MKALLLKKSVKLSLATLAAYKLGDTLLQYPTFNERRINFMSRLQMTAADSKNEEEKKKDLFYETVNDDVVAGLLKNEFTGDLSKIPLEQKVKYDFKLKTREEHLKEIMNPATEYDLLIIGGGANGAGVALEGASRGLKCCVIDSYDFASGTSSRSTKMAHGGLRYFE